MGLVRLLGTMLVLHALVISGQAQTPAVREVGPEGLRIQGKLTAEDPKLAFRQGAPHQVFLVALKKRQHYVLELRSKEFDAYLLVEREPGKILAHDDDSGGGLDSRLGFVAPADGEYRLLAASLDRKLGAFALTVRAQELSAEEKRQAEARRL